MLRNTKKGFTLIEIIVAAALFSLISLAITNLFISAIKGQRQITSLQAVQENGRYLMESISKEIRTSQIISSDGTTNTLQIKNANGENVEYVFSNKQITRNGEILNSGNIKTDGRFYIKKTNSQPRATVIMVLNYKSDKPEESVKINLETTMSSRIY